MKRNSLATRSKTVILGNSSDMRRNHENHRKSFGKGKVRVNFTEWSDEEYIRKMNGMISEIEKNYYRKIFFRRIKFYYKKLKDFFYNNLRKTRLLKKLKKALVPG